MSDWNPALYARFADERNVLPHLLKERLGAVKGRLAAADQTAVEEWLKKGGMVLRFAGARLSEGGDDFIPVPLRGGGRTFGGAMSWGQAEKTTMRSISARRPTWLPAGAIGGSMTSPPSGLMLEFWKRLRGLGVSPATRPIALRAL